MSDTMLLSIAVAVFSLLVIGLALTVYEFKAHIIEQQDKKRASKKK